MNKVILMGRLTSDPEIKEASVKVARYRLAVDRRFKRDSDTQTADFIPCVVFGKGAEFADMYLHKGTKIVVTGRIQTGSYKNKEGQTVYTTEVVIDEQEFAESKKASNQKDIDVDYVDGDFIKIPEGVQEELPFK